MSQKHNQPQFKINSQNQQQRSFRNVPTNMGYTGMKNYRSNSGSNGNTQQQQQQNNLPSNININFPNNINTNSTTVVSKTLLDSKNINGTLVETYQFKYSDNTFLNKTYIDGFLISSVDPVGGTRVTYITNIQETTDFINRQRGSDLKYQYNSGYLNNMNYESPDLYQQLQEYQDTTTTTSEPNYENRFLSNLIV